MNKKQRIQDHSSDAFLYFINETIKEAQLKIKTALELGCPSVSLDIKDAKIILNLACMYNVNTVNCNDFKPYNDDMLKKLTKDDLINYIIVLSHNFKVIDELYKNTMEHVKKLQKELDNPPLYFEELEEGMWVYDIISGNYRHIRCLSNEKRWVGFKISGYIDIGGHIVRDSIDWITFEKNRFYRREIFIKLKDYEIE